MSFDGRHGQWVRLTLNDDTVVEGIITREWSTTLWIGAVPVYKNLIVMAGHKNSQPPPKEK